MGNILDTHSSDSGSAGVGSVGSLRPSGCHYHDIILVKVAETSVASDASSVASSRCSELGEEQLGGR